MEDDKLYAEQAAELAGLTVATWRRYCSTAGGRNRIAPPADGEDQERGHVRPYWYEATITAWKDNRIGRGAPGVPRPHKPPTTD